MPKAAADTIAAVATPPGTGGIGIVRISGSDISPVGRGILSSGKIPPPRRAVYEKFTGADGGVIDSGLCLYFRAPHSFTGQDVLELHGHGGAAVSGGVLSRCLELGARPAEPGEFTLRAYLNGKLDLAQAEAVADLINANAAGAARAAANSLSGAFSLRRDMEASLDFADEETGAPVDFSARLGGLLREAEQFLADSEQGARLSRGLTAAVVGAPNVGKSSLFNRLCGEDAAIVSSAAGTTRDIIFREVVVGGVALRLADTAGLRGRAGEIEKEGMARALKAAEGADFVILVRDNGSAPEIRAAEILTVHNKTDIRGIPAGEKDGEIYVSAKTGAGLDDLRAAISDMGGGSEAPFTARARHVAALKEAVSCITEAQNCGAQAELAASWLASAQSAAESLLGAADDEKLLGEIFSRFCVGK